MPLLASGAHPRGPQDLDFSERVLIINGKDKGISLTLAFPKPDEIVDWTVGGEVDANETFSRALTLRFRYKGYFWQGVFGTVGLDVNIKSRKGELEPWKNFNNLLDSVSLNQRVRNQATFNENSKSRREWKDPFLSQLNGTKCVQQYVQVGYQAKDEIHYYFLLDDDHALEIVFLLVDNSDRPGLGPSDWRPRAEEFLNRLLSEIKVSPVLVR